MTKKRNPGPASYAANYADAPRCACGCGFPAGARHYDGRVVGFRKFARGHVQSRAGRPPSPFPLPRQKIRRPIFTPDRRRIDQEQFLAELYLGRPIGANERVCRLHDTDGRKVGGLVIVRGTIARVFTCADLRSRGLPPLVTRSTARPKRGTPGTTGGSTGPGRARRPATRA